MKSVRRGRKCSLRLPGGCMQHLLAGGRQLRQRDRGTRFWRLFRRRGMKDFVLEPVTELRRLAAVVLGLLLLSLALAAAGRASHADVEVIVVSVPRPDLVQPAAVALGL